MYLCSENRHPAGQYTDPRTPGLGKGAISGAPARQESLYPRLHLVLPGAWWAVVWSHRPQWQAGQASWKQAGEWPSASRWPEYRMSMGSLPSGTRGQSTGWGTGTPHKTSRVGLNSLGPAQHCWFCFPEQGRWSPGDRGGALSAAGRVLPGHSSSGGSHGAATLLRPLLAAPQVAG